MGNFFGVCCFKNLSYAGGAGIRVGGYGSGVLLL